MTETAFTFIDLFAGIGGMRLGFEAVGGECVFTSEWDKKAQETYQANFGGDEEIAGDIREVDETEVPDHDVLLAGFPCQPFSIAGVSKKNALGRAHGFDCQTQGTLFFDIQRVIDAKRPAAFVLENVKNLRSHDKGRTFEVIKAVLQDELGYELHWRVIDAAGFVPQHRERIFLIGFREPTGFDADDILVPEASVGPTLLEILHPGDGTETPEPPYTQGGKARPATKYTLTPKLWAYLKGYAEKHRLKGNGFGYGLVGPNDVSRTLSARYYKDGSEILVKQPRRRPRRLTPRECSRLMGFEVLGERDWEIPVSDNQAYKQFGNAVVPQVVEAVAAAIKPAVMGVIAGEPEVAEPELEDGVAREVVGDLVSEWLRGEVTVEQAAAN
jgi:DNA (cytosine-5)-methyltransferase 1